MEICYNMHDESTAAGGVTLGMGAPLLAPPSPIWRLLSIQEAVLFILNVSFRIKSRQNGENDGKDLKKCTFLA